MSQRLVLAALKELGGTAHIYQIRDLLVKQGHYGSDVMLSGLVAARLRQMERWGEVEQIGKGEFRLTARAD